MLTWLTAAAPRWLHRWGLRWRYEVLAAVVLACAGLAGGYWSAN